MTTGFWRASIGILLVAGFSAALRAQAQSSCVGDCNSDLSVTVDEIVLAVNIALGVASLTECQSADANSDQEVTVDEILALVTFALQGCPAAHTPTPSSPTPASTPTPVFSPGQLAVSITSHSAIPRTICISGTMETGSLRNSSSHYGCSPPPAGTPASGCTPECRTLNPDEDVTISINGLSPGEWLHRVDVAESGQAARQLQYLRSRLVSDPARPNSISWQVFNQVLTVTTSNGTGMEPPPTPDDCPGSNCSFREAIGKASAIGSGERPVLINFASGLAAPYLRRSDPHMIVDRDGTTVDGTDANGDPNPLRAFGDRKYPTRIHLYNVESTIRVTASDTEFRGIGFSRELDPENVAASDRDFLRYSGSGKRGLVTTSRFDGDAIDISQHIVGRDGIDVNSNGATNYDEALIIENVEIRNCPDRGVKSLSGYVVVRDSWIRNNLQGGLFAQNGDGHIKAERNIIEFNGWTCPANTPDPMNCNGNAIANVDSTAISTQNSSQTSGVRSHLVTDGNIIRNGGQGALSTLISLGNYSETTIVRDFVCGTNAADSSLIAFQALEVKSHAGAPNPVTVFGSAFVRSQRGVRIIEASGSTGNISLGSGMSGTGDNAFVANSAWQVVNESASSLTFAERNQWNSCGNASSCSSGAVASNDVDGALDFTPAQAHRNPGALEVNNVSPAHAQRGDLVWVFGAGFNAVEGHKNPLAPTPTPFTSCNTLAGMNTCNPVRGTCVEFLDVDSGSWEPALDIVAVTPRMVVAKVPITCKQPTSVRVRTLDSNGEIRTSDTVADFCRVPTPGP